ncbi:MBL fold metallo-hydrolase [Mesorhizobium sp. WSM4303]|uniref:MBL fold metallo-hydrolase n=1 Tax=unclassified Mesorhizobium TaxID=325217 RepID=UPI00115F2FEA|nr:MULTISPECIES: MBL fold metallo-hydrolase [unclassified Mesorhizobium]TRC96893.1 MBL fold metallo-hydrolase [Mesorhizobium sp. WSM4303]TRD00714.1 MBL fold metallo-hydrolase [Mesorhizobium sp. WSM4306]
MSDTRPRVFSFDLGSFKVAALLDAVDVRDNLAAAFAPGQSPRAVQELAVSNSIDPVRYDHCFIPTLVDTGTEKILFDTGFGDDDSALLQCLRDLGLEPGDIDLVVITHGHPDHIGGLMNNGEAVFSRARYVFGAAEFVFWIEADTVREARLNNRDLFRRICAGLADRATFVAPGDEIVPGVTAIDAAGHSPGLLAFHVESDGQQLLIWSDAFLHSVVSIQRPDWHADLDDEKEQSVETRKRLLNMAADHRLLVAGYHMPFPGIGYVERVNGSFHWLPVGDQLNV